MQNHKSRIAISINNKETIYLSSIQLLMTYAQFITHKKYIFMVYIEATVANKYKQNIMYIFNFMGQIILLAP